MCAEKPRPLQPSCEDPAGEGWVVFYGEEALTRMSLGWSYLLIYYFDIN